MYIYRNGERMPVSETGMITRECLGNKYSDDWRLLGAVRFNNFGNIVERTDFSGRLLQLKWQHKNGKQKWHIVDLDHGTPRVWISPNHTIEMF